VQFTPLALGAEFDAQHGAARLEPIVLLSELSRLGTGLGEVREVCVQLEHEVRFDRRHGVVLDGDPLGHAVSHAAPKHDAERVLRQRRAMRFSVRAGYLQPRDPALRLRCPSAEVLRHPPTEGEVVAREDARLEIEEPLTPRGNIDRAIGLGHQHAVPLVHNMERVVRIDGEHHRAPWRRERFHTAKQCNPYSELAPSQRATLMRTLAG
jgi:hypothetical protein